MLKIQNLTLRMGNKEVLNSLTFDCIPGYLYPIIGSNGAGKTTLLKVYSRYSAAH